MIEGSYKTNEDEISNDNVVGIRENSVMRRANTSTLHHIPAIALIKTQQINRSLNALSKIPLECK